MVGYKAPTILLYIGTSWLTHKPNATNLRQQGQQGQKTEKRIKKCGW